MQRFFRRTSVALAALSLTGPAVAADARGDGIASLLDRDTFFFARADAGAFVDGVKGLDVVRLLEDEEMKAFLEPLYEAVPFLSADDPVGSIWSLVPVLDFVQGEVAFGLSGIALHIEMPDGSVQVERVSPSHPLRARMFHQLASYHESYRVNGQVVETRGALPFQSFAVDFLLSVEPGPALRGMIHDYLRDPPDYAEIGEVVMGGRGVTAIRCRIPDGDGITTTVYADLSGDRWLFGGDQESFAAALAGGPQHPLSTSPSYRSFSERLASGTNVMMAYLDLSTALKAVRSCIPPIVMEELGILGVDAFRGVGVGVSMVEGGVRESLLLGFDGEADGLFSALDCFGGGFRSLAEAPANTGAFFGLRFDVNQLRASVMEIVSTLAPRMRGLAEQQLAATNIEGWNLVDDILPALGGEVSIFASPTNAGPIPDVMFTLEVRDEARFAKLLEFLKGAVAEEGVQISPLALKGGEDGFVVRIPDAPVQPSFALRNGRLIGAISAYTLKSYLQRHVDNASAETLGQASAVLPRMMNGLVGGRAESLALLAYLDLHSTLPMIYGTAAPMLQPAFDESGLPLDAAMLPMADTLQPYFTGLALGVSRDAGGLGVHLFSPTGLLPAALTALIAEEAGGRATRAARRQGDSD